MQPPWIFPSQNFIFCLLSFGFFITNFIQINGLFLLKHKLAFAPQEDNSARDVHKDSKNLQMGNATSTPLLSTVGEQTAEPKLPFDNINFRKDVERIYEKWMLERRNQMFDKMRQGFASQSEAKAFQEVLEQYFGNCICDADATICQIYQLSC